MLRKKSQVTRPGIDPGTFRLVAQRLNHYATPGPYIYIYKVHLLVIYILLDLIKARNIEHTEIQVEDLKYFLFTPYRLRPNTHTIFHQLIAEGSQTSSACHSGTVSMRIKTSMEHSWNDTGREKVGVLRKKQTPLSLNPPQKPTRTGPRL